MKLTSRDAQIIEYIYKYKGITLNQAAKLFFNNSYKATSKRMLTLEKLGEFKSAYDNILNRKVFYINKIPSYHNLIANNINIELGDNILFSEKEYLVGTHRVDYFVILKNKEIRCYEIDIYNKTSNTILQKLHYDLLKVGNAKIIIIGKNRVKYKRLLNYIEYKCVDDYNI